jgi:hypothetical protein
MWDEKKNCFMALAGATGLLQKEIHKTIVVAGRTRQDHAITALLDCLKAVFHCHCLQTRLPAMATWYPNNKDENRLNGQL